MNGLSDKAIEEVQYRGHKQQVCRHCGGEVFRFVKDFPVERFKVYRGSDGDLRRLTYSPEAMAPPVEPIACLACAEAPVRGRVHRIALNGQTGDEMAWPEPEMPGRWVDASGRSPMR